MEVDTALRARGSTRAFLSRAVPRAMIESILERARFAPSGTNIQPWNVHVVSGATRDRLCREVRDAATHQRDAHRPPFEYYPTQWREPYLARRRACGWGLYTLLGIKKGDRAGGLAHQLRNYDLFDAPVGLFFFLDDDLTVGSWLDYGMFLQSVMLAAQDAGLATCPQASWAPFHGIVRAVLGVPDSRILLCGMALGYADPAAAINSFRPARLDVAQFATWHDGEAAR